MKRETRTSQVNLRWPPSLVEAAKKAAEEESRSLTSYIEKLVSDDLRKRNLAKDGKRK